MSPSDHERAEPEVVMRGVKVRSMEGRTPTINDRPPAEARTNPPLVAVAVASTRSDHRVLLVGRKNNCQKVLAGWLRSPMGMVAHTPLEVWTDVSSGVGAVRAARSGPTAAEGWPVVEQPVTAAAPKKLSAISAATQRWRADVELMRT
jgi:hypothetical protein